jgi:hypothetical protein
VELLKVLEAWSDDQMQQVALDCAALIDPAGAAGAGYTRCW